MVQQGHDRSIILCTIKWGIMQWKFVYIIQFIIIGYETNGDVCQREHMPPNGPTLVCSPLHYPDAFSEVVDQFVQMGPAFLD